MIDRRSHATLKQLVIGIGTGVALAVLSGGISAYVTVQILLTRVDQLQYQQNVQFQELSNRIDNLADK